MKRINGKINTRKMKKQNLKKFTSSEKKIIKFGIRSISKLKYWNKKANLSLAKSKKFTDGLKKRA